MVQEIQCRKPIEEELNDRDRVYLDAMLDSNSEWVVTTHNGHITKIKKVGRAPYLPEFFVRFALANEIE